MSQSRSKLHSQSGVSLIEVLITICIFLILVGGIYFTFANVLEIMGRTRLRTLATSVLNKEIEILRNVPFDQVGTVSGSPAGVLLAQKTVLYENNSFVVKSYVRNIDDAFDGKQGGTPNDTAPADYRMVQLEVSCPTCFRFAPVTYTTWVAPQTLESTSKNGSLFINTFDANGQPVGNVSVSVVNNSTSPAISITDSTNNSGTLQLVDIPTSTTAYQITVSKNGYSSAQTYKPGAAANPNPIQPHATVATQQITSISFGVDRVSTLNVKTQDAQCNGVASIPFNQVGSKLIGSGPNVNKYSSSFTTDTSGLKTISSLEWDTYTFTNTSAVYDLAGSIPLAPLTIDPNTTVGLSFLLEPKASTSLMATVVDASSTPILGATVTIAKTGTNLTQITGKKFLSQTDWSNGNYNAQDGNLADANPAGDVKLAQNGGVYPTSTNSYLISNTYDLGTTTGTVLYDLVWTPTTQPSQCGTNCLKFQIASNTDNSTWNYLGPDGTGSTYYTATSTIGTMHDGHRYLRYKAYLNTVDQNYTPTLSSVQIGFTSSCVPQGQTLFSNIPTGTYTMTVSKSGYTTATSSVSVVSGWQEKRLTLQ